MTAASVVNSPQHWVEAVVEATGQTVLPPVNITGAKAGNVALTNLIAALVTIGLVTDSTT